MTKSLDQQAVTPVWAIALTGLFVLAIIYTLYLAADIFKPIAFAILLNVLLSPLVRRFERLGIVPRISAAFIMLTLVAITALGITVLAEPAERWLAEAPTTVRELKAQVLETKGKLADIQELAEEVEEIASVESPDAPQPVVVEGPGMLEGLLGGLPYIVTGAAIVVFLTYFLLASGDSMLRRMTRCARTWSGRRRVVTVVREIQADLSTYLATVTIINVVLGLVTALLMYFLEVPNPLLWGTMVGALNFAPYIGALASVLVLTVVGLTSFDSLAHGLAVPLVTLILTALEGQLITPAILGRRMSLNPTVVFISVLVWGWLWGVAGALMAVPIMTSLKVWLDHMPTQQHLSAFLRSDNRPQRVSRSERESARATTTSPLQTEGGRP